VSYGSARLVSYGGKVSWLFAWLGLTLAGLVVLTACAVKVFFGVRALGREVDRTWRRLAPERRALRDELRTLQGKP
jgi:hypothetical protein